MKSINIDTEKEMYQAIFNLNGENTIITTSLKAILFENIIQFISPQYSIFNIQNNNENINIFVLNNFLYNCQKSDKNIAITNIFNNSHSNYINIKQGNKINSHQLSSELINAGYTKNANVYSNFEFSIRGDVIDISMYNKAYRINIQYDTIELIKELDIAKQLSLAKVSEINVYHCV